MKPWIWLTLMACSCSLQAPEIKVTGERSLLEKQMLGSYQSFSLEMWMATSLRGLPDSVATEGERENLLKAIRRRRFNQDDRLRLQSAGLLGETRTGRLEAREGSRPPTPAELDLLQRLVRQENQDRDVLFARLLRLYPDQEQEDLTRIFSGIQREEAPRGTWIQQTDGSWSHK